LHFFLEGSGYKDRREMWRIWKNGDTSCAEVIKESRIWGKSFSAQERMSIFDDATQPAVSLYMNFEVSSIPTCSA